MVSAVENMAANTSWSALGKATDLRNRILFTLGLLIVYRLGTFIPVPGIDGAALRDFMESAGQGIGGMVSMFTGGALGRMGIQRPNEPTLALPGNDQPRDGAAQSCLIQQLNKNDRAVCNR
jgi:hypothetical protein